MKEVIKTEIEKAIEEWIAAGGDLLGFTCKTNYKVATVVWADIVDAFMYIDYKLPNIDNLFTYKKNIYEFIFGTDFIDKLVGDGRPVCGMYGEIDCGDEGMLSRKCKFEKGNRCKYFFEWKGAAYHRQYMANIKNFDNLKEYIRALAAEQTGKSAVTETQKEKL